MTISLRPLRTDDLPRLAEVFASSFASHGHIVVTTAEELAEELEPPYCTMATDAVVAVQNERIIGGAYTLHLPANVGQERCYVEGKVDPSSLGLGAGRALLDWGLARAWELLSHDSGIPRVIRVNVPDQDRSVESLLHARGLRPVRWFSTLLRPLDGTARVTEPLGITIVPWDPDRSVETLAVSNTSFADHRGSAPMLAEGWSQRTTGFGAHAGTSFMALDNDTVVAFLVSHRYDVDDDAAGMQIGWINQLGTLPDYRRRGVASALIGRALSAYRAEGWTHAALEVDNDNPTGAHGLYSSLGFEPWRGAVTWEKPRF